MPLVAHGGQFYSGSYVKANPAETATGTLTKVQIDNDVYEIQGGGGGTTVVANPSGQATANLEKLQVGETIYEVVGQGGQGMTKTLLWGNMPFSYPSTQISDATLSADIKDFDEIIIYGGWYSDNVHDFREERFDAKVLDSLPTATTDLSKQFVMVMNPYVQNGAQYSQWIRISKGSADNIIHFRYNNAVGVYAIVGVKYDTGSSSGGTGGKPSKTSLYRGENTSVNVELPLLDDITKYNELEFVVGFNNTDKSRACFRCSVADFISKFPYTGSAAKTNPQFITTVYDTYYMCFQCGSADNKIYIVRSDLTKLYEINGIKYGGSSSEWTKVWQYGQGNVTIPSGSTEIMVVFTTIFASSNAVAFSAIYPLTEPRSVIIQATFTDRFGDVISFSLFLDGTTDFSSTSSDPYSVEVWAR